MKRKWQIAFYLLLYLLILSFALSFDLWQLVSLRDIGIFAVGAMLLALPFWKRSSGLSDFFLIWGEHAIDAGILQTFLLLFIRLSEKKGYEGLLADVALCFRPVLYAFCIRLILESEEKGESKREIIVREISYEDCIKAGLTKREAELAVLVCRGCSNGEIAEELVISQATVKKHMSNIFEKTGIKGREELKTYIEQYRE